MKSSHQIDGLPHILIVDDDKRLRELLCRYLRDNGYRATAAANVEEAQKKSQLFEFDALILDVMMPGQNGFEYAQTIRKDSAIPILMLTARTDFSDRIRGLEIGVDDYLAKPFDPRELTLRLNNILKRSPPSDSEQKEELDEIRFGPFTFGFSRGELRQDGELIRLTEREREILVILGKQRGAVVAREELSTSESDTNERTVDVQINRLRRKIETDPANPLFLQTVRGAGYRLVIDRP